MPTRRRLAPVLVAVALASAPLRGAEHPEDAAMKAMAAGRYEEASGLLKRRLEQVPGDHRVLYNLACCHSRLGEVDEAARTLREAWKAGFRDLDLVRSDEDLEALRGSAPGRKLLEDLEREEARRMRAQGRPLPFEAGVLGTCRVVAPEKVAPGRRYPLVLALHGHGGQPEPLAGIFQAAGLRPGFFVAAPYGPYPVRLPETLGFSWYPPEWRYQELLAVADGPADEARDRRRALQEREQDVSERHVLAALDAVLAAYPVDPGRIVLLGHSQGGTLAYGLALGHPERFLGLVVVGSSLPDRLAGETRLAAAAAQGLRVLVCHSPGDDAIAFARGEASHRRLAGAGITSRLERYEGGHGLTAALLRSIHSWIEDLEERR